MSKVKLSMFLILSTLLLPLYQANAAELNAMIFAQDDKAFGTLKTKQVASISYGGSAKELFNGIDKTIEFKADINTAGVREMIDKMNQNLLALNSPAQFEEITINYKGRISGDEHTAIIDISIIIDYTLTDFVISGNPASAEGAKVDINWRGVTVNEPLVITPEGVGPIDINTMKGFLDVAAPAVSEALQSGAEDVLSTSLIDFSDMKELSIKNWAASFDASGGVAEAEKYGLAADVPPVITTLAKGEGSLREGQVKEIEIERDVSINGESVKVEMIIPPAYSTMRFAGYATTEVVGNDEFAIVTNEQAGKQIYQSQNLPIMVVGVFAAMAAIITGVVIWRVNKTSNKQ